MSASFAIGSRVVGDGSPCFVIAEAGVNHNGDAELARGLVDAAAAAGADAVKFQTFMADQLASPAAPKAAYQLETTSRDESQLEMLRRLELAPALHRELRARCADRGIQFLSTPFDEGSVDLLMDVGVPAFKVSSGDLTNEPLLARIARTGLPIILSTGMATMEEVEAAVRTLRDHGGERIALLHCVSRYPAAPSEVNLAAMATMREALGLPVGYSDHTEGTDVAIAAVALGACILEKHFTLDRSLPGPDHRMSLEPGELVALVLAVRRVEAARGHGRKEPAPSEAEVAAVARKSVVAAVDIPSGARLSASVLRVMRPGTGLPPSMWDQIVGRRTRERIPAGTPLVAEMLL
jgi:N-acetylneuraminate synthase